jgi:hypothetical protein
MVPRNFTDLVDGQDSREELLGQSAAAVAKNGGEKSLYFETPRKSQRMQPAFPWSGIISFCRGLAMSARVTFPLKLGALELQLSPFRPTDEDLRRSVDGPLMASVVKFDKRGLNMAHPESPLTPELKEFIVRAIVPALVKEYLALNETENKLADEPPGAAHSVADSNRSTAAALRSVRP